MEGGSQHRQPPATRMKGCHASELLHVADTALQGISAEILVPDTPAADTAVECASVKFPAEDAAVVDTPRTHAEGTSVEVAEEGAAVESIAGQSSSVADFPKEGTAVGDAAQAGIAVGAANVHTWRHD